MIEKSRVNNEMRNKILLTKYASVNNEPHNGNVTRKMITTNSLSVSKTKIDRNNIIIIAVGRRSLNTMEFLIDKIINEGKDNALGHLCSVS